MTEKNTPDKLHAPRKRKYDQCFCDDIIEYFSSMLSERTKKGFLVEIPSFTGFSKKIGVCITSIKNWRKKHPAFDEACSECEEMLKESIVNDSLLFKMNGSFAKYILAARYGIIEKIEYQGNNGVYESTPELIELLTIRKRRLEDDKQK